MGRRKQNQIPKNDFAPEEDIDVCSFTSEPVTTGECVSSFSFDDDDIKENKTNVTTTAKNISNINKSSNGTIDFNISSTNEQNIKNNASSNNITPSNTKNKSNNNTAISNNNTAISNNQNASGKNNILEDNRKAPIANGMAPPVDGELLDVKRTYMLRASTVRKINELKSIHSELNTYVSTIVDLAIAHYYNHIINEGGSQ